MDENQVGNEPSAFTETNAAIRETARDVRHALQEGQTPGQWKEILGSLVREAPLPSLFVAFLVGVIVARR